MRLFPRLALAAMLVCGLSVEADAARVNLPLRCTDESGDVVNGCRAYTFQAGTSTIYQTFSDSALTVVHGDYVTADSAGEFPDTYAANTQCLKIEYRLSDGTTVIDTLDDFCPTLSTSEINTSLLTGTAAAESVGTSGNALGKLNTANTYSALQTFNSNIEVNSTSAAATAAPAITLSRDSTSPVANDDIGEMVFQGKDDGTGDVNYGSIYTSITDPTDTQEDGAPCIKAIVAGTETEIACVGVFDSTDTSLTGIALMPNDYKYYFKTSSTFYPQERCTAIETQTASTSATLDFETIPTGTTRLIIYFERFVPATDDVGLYVRLKFGGSFQSGASDYAWRSFLGDSSSSTMAAQIEISDTNATESIGSTSGEFADGFLIVENPLETSTTKIIDVQMRYINASAGLQKINTIGRFVGTGSTGALQGIRFLMESGNITSGSATSYACFD